MISQIITAIVIWVCTAESDIYGTKYTAKDRNEVQAINKALDRCDDRDGLCEITECRTEIHYE